MVSGRQDEDVLKDDKTTEEKAYNPKDLKMNHAPKSRLNRAASAPAITDLEDVLGVQRDANPIAANTNKSPDTASLGVAPLSLSEDHPNNQSGSLVTAAAHYSPVSLADGNMFTKVREVIINDLVTQNKIDRKHGEALQRAIDHVMRETVEVLSWIPKISKGTQKDQPLSQDLKNAVIIHYGHPLFTTMYRAASEAGTYEYLTNKIIHLGGILTTAKPKLRKFLNNTKDVLDLKNATIYIPICYGTDKHLSEDSLKAVIDFYLENGASSVCVYLGEYNSVDHPLKTIDETANLKREAWLAKNNPLIQRAKADNRIKIILRSEWITMDRYKEASDIFENHLLQRKDIYYAIISDAMRYMGGKIKNYSPKVTFSVEQEQEIIDEFSLATEEVLDKPASASAQDDPVVDRILQRVENSKDDQVVDRLASFTAKYLRHSSIFAGNNPAQSKLKAADTAAASVKSLRK